MYIHIIIIYIYNLFRHAKAILEKDKIRNTLRDIDNEFDRLQIVLRKEGDEKKKIEQKLSHFSNLTEEIKKLQSKVNTINQSFACKYAKAKFIIQRMYIFFLLFSFGPDQTKISKHCVIGFKKNV